jgi:hypothetical protein
MQLSLDLLFTYNVSSLPTHTPQKKKLLACKCSSAGEFVYVSRALLLLISSFSARSISKRFSRSDLILNFNKNMHANHNHLPSPSFSRSIHYPFYTGLLVVPLVKFASSVPPTLCPAVSAITPSVSRHQVPLSPRMLQQRGLRAQFQM